ncbi:MAG TPA: CAP domain-containing protein, partial [Sphingobacteriaceae bacterium]
MLRLTLILFLIAAGYPASAQINRDLDPKNPDLRLLERRTFDAVNMLRANRKTALLAWDDVLYRAAIDHAVYLIHEGKLSHEQRSRERATPSMRVKLHGGFVYGQVGENLASVTLGVEMTSKGKKLSTYSYSATATALAQLWKASPLHYRNLLQKAFNTSALALAYDPQSRRVVAVQVFGYAAEFAGSNDQPDHSVELLRTPERKLPFGLRHTDPQTKQNTRAIRAFLRLRGINGHLTGSYKVAKKAFKGRRAGLAVEWVPLAQFDSGAVEFDRVRNRRNGLHALNGELDRPVYRRQLLRYSRRASPRKVFLDLRIVRIYKREKKFIYPIGAGSGANIFLVHKKRLVTYTTPMGLPSDLLFAPLPELPFRNSFIVSDRKEKFFKQTRTDTLTVKVFYPAGEIDIDSTTSWKLVNDLNTIRGKVVKIDAYAFASIEGEMLANQELARQRANTFMAVVKPFLDTVTVVPTLSSK